VCTKLNKITLINTYLKQSISFKPAFIISQLVLNMYVVYKYSLSHIGYEDLGTLEGCVNIDECSEPSVNCTVKSTCIDTDGSYVCQCLFGYRDTGNGCVNIDECALGNKCSQVRSYYTV